MKTWIKRLDHFVEKYSKAPHTWFPHDTLGVLPHNLSTGLFKPFHARSRNMSVDHLELSGALPILTELFFESFVIHTFQFHKSPFLLFERFFELSQSLLQIYKSRPHKSDKQQTNHKHVVDLVRE